MIHVTENELVEALLAATRPEDASGERGALTVLELAGAMGKDIRVVRGGIRALLGAGKMEVTKVRRSAIDGRVQHLPAYRLKG